MNYEEQAKDFLKHCGVIFYAVKAVPQKFPLWAEDGKHGIHWSITLAKIDKTKQLDFIGRYRDMRHAITKEIEFSFWGSIHDKEKARHRMSGIDRKPCAYDVLAGIYYPSVDFKDFCDSFGYDNDSIKALKTFKEVEILNSKIESIFSGKELRKLSEIQ